MPNAPVVSATIDRTRLLPRSGIGVDAPWLIIAPPGNPIIRLNPGSANFVLRSRWSPDTA